MKKSVLRVAAVFLTIITVAGLFYGCSGTKAPNEGIDTITDKNGVTYLAIIDEKDGHTLAGVTDKDGNLFAAETNASGEVLSDGNLYSVSYTGEIPTNDTTAVSINESQNTDYNYANKDVVSEDDTTAPTKDEETTEKPATTEATTKKNDKDKNKNKNKKEKTYLAEKYKTLFQSGTFYVEFSTEDDTVPYPIKAAVKNGNIYMKTQYEGMDCTMIYQKKKDSVYIVLSDYHVYCKMPSSMIEDLDLSDFVDSTDVKSVDVSEVNIGERECICESYELEDGSVSNYYFYNGELVRLDQISTDGESSIMNITGISSSVDNSLFELPKGYIPINLSKFNFGEEATTEK